MAKVPKWPVIPAGHSSHKIAKNISVPRTEKVARTIADPDQYWRARPSWRISVLDMADPYGWHVIDHRTLDYIRGKLVDFESMTWRDILLDGRKQNHAIEVERICTKAQKRLAVIGQSGIDQVISLHLSGKERVFGIRIGSVLELLWWDPKHEICPSNKKHT